MVDEVVPAATVSVRMTGGKTIDDRDWPEADLDLLAAAVPWRTFRWHKGQKHYSGTYYSATDHQHVIYESRLELANLLLADHDVSVNRIIAQPFLLHAKLNGEQRRHVPDYLLLTDTGPVVVDVKPQSRLDRPKIAFTLAWTRKLVEHRGWRYEVRTEPPESELANVRFLAGYRRDWLFAEDLLHALLAADLEGATLADAFQSQPAWPQPLVRAAVCHLLWRNLLLVDLSRPLSRAHLIRKP